MVCAESVPLWRVRNYSSEILLVVKEEHLCLDLWTHKDRALYSCFSSYKAGIMDSWGLALKPKNEKVMVIKGFFFGFNHHARRRR